MPSCDQMPSFFCFNSSRSSSVLCSGTQASKTKNRLSQLRVSAGFSPVSPTKSCTTHRSPNTCQKEILSVWKTGDTNQFHINVSTNALNAPTSKLTVKVRDNFVGVFTSGNLLGAYSTSSPVRPPAQRPEGEGQK